MNRVLVVPSGTEVAQEIVRSLSVVKGVELYGANGIDCFTEIPRDRQIIGIPFIDEPGFINEISNIIKDKKITHIFPAHDSASLKLSEFAESLGVKVITSSYETNKVCRSKSLTYKALEKVVKVPKTYNSKFEVDTFPVFVKPNIGQGSVGTKLITEAEQLNAVTEDDILCEYLPGEEYTVDCISDANNQLQYARARKRNAMRNGIATETELVTENHLFYAFAEKINATLKLQGAWFFQVKEDIDGELCLLEVATRIAGSMITSRMNGVNFAEMSLFISNGVPVKALDNNLEIKLYRNLAYQFDINLNFDVLYTDFDDCLIFGDKVNDKLVQFIYQCINKNVEVILISRHAHDLQQTLKNMKLSQLFDKVIHITDGTPKSQFITEPNAIFIDDSFRERLDVLQECNIPCFSVDMVQGLTCLKS
ncbi:ATP-grasp domain-containing protein [Pseudoalteromonas sp. bablab_jr011]|jgi:hypothetical protein|uniref:ATP-grasp domain-containing protein n=1 Tax=Pseudoalteromonas sp. bablab_jr011 TaxID=2755062 RepID=UPI0018F6B4CC|nr:ATP-grasp domain-containing protein [Pseudoalteromonas sp. bablab_jr011]